MKKSLVALAVLAASGAYAQSSVTLFGIVEAGVDVGYNRTQESTSTVNTFNAAGAGLSSSPGPATSIQQKNGFRVQDGNSQGTGTSRIGFRGTEDLGGGLKANFLLEMGLRLDDGAITNGSGNVASSGPSGGNAFGRNAWGGVSGGFGEFRIGRQVLGSFAVQGNSGSSGASNGLYDATTATLLPMGGVRFSNAIRYLSPNFGGFTGSLMLAAPETNPNGDPAAPMGAGATSSSTTAGGVGGLTTNSTTKRRTGVDLALEYANGPAYVGFGYNKRDNANLVAGTLPGPFFPGTTSTTNSFAGTITPSASPFPNFVPTASTATGYTLGGAYDLGVVKPFVNYTREKTNFNNSSGFVSVVPGGNTFTSNSGDVNARAFSVGLRAPVGAFTVIAGYGRINTTTNVLLTNTTAGGVTTATSGNLQEKRDAFQIGAQYALSKRTLVQANYGYNKLRGNGSAVDTSTAAGANRTESFISGTDRITAVNVGLKHSF